MAIIWCRDYHSQERHDNKWNCFIWAQPGLTVNFFSKSLRRTFFLRRRVAARRAELASVILYFAAHGGDTRPRSAVSAHPSQILANPNSCPLPPRMCVRVFSTAPPICHFFFRFPPPLFFGLSQLIIPCSPFFCFPPPPPSPRTICCWLVLYCRWQEPFYPVSICNPAREESVLVLVSLICVALYFIFHLHFPPPSLLFVDFFKTLKGGLFQEPVPAAQKLIPNPVSLYVFRFVLFLFFAAPPPTIFIYFLLALQESCVQFSELCVPASRKCINASPSIPLSRTSTVRVFFVYFLFPPPLFFVFFCLGRRRLSNFCIYSCCWETSSPCRFTCR